MNEEIKPFFYYLEEHLKVKTIQALEDELWVSKSSLQRWMSGEGGIKVSTAADISTHLGVDKEVLVKSSLLTQQLAAKGLLNKDGSLKDPSCKFKPVSNFLKSTSFPFGDSPQTMRMIADASELSDREISEGSEIERSTLSSICSGNVGVGTKIAARMATFLGEVAKEKDWPSQNEKMLTAEDIMRASDYTVALYKKGLIDSHGDILTLQQMRQAIRQRLPAAKVARKILYADRSIQN